jgi:cyanophycin synthetase
VLETARGAVADSGMCFDWSSIGVCLNVSSDHLGDKGIDTLEQMAELKRSIVATARDAVILNADDTLCLAMLPFPGTECVGLVSTWQSWAELRKGHPHCRHFALQELVDGSNWLVIYSGEQRIEVLPVREIAATFDGRATFNISNILHASLACHFVGASLEHLRRGLRDFRMGFDNTPGRLNFYEHLPFRVLVDYAHNPDGVARLCEFVDRLDVQGNKFIALSAAGYNPEEVIKGNALAAAGFFDYYACFNYLRNIASNHHHVPGILREGFLAAGVPEERISVADCGLDALDMILKRVQPGDLVVMLAGHSDRKEIRERLLSTPSEPPGGGNTDTDDSGRTSAPVT